ncbi:hypothetical protein [Thiomicrospira aerophila]|nr:hypothetical protein [Thiomicrospira aerophila]
MDKLSFKADILKSGQAERCDGVVVEINNILPYVSIVSRMNEEHSYFFQGDEAIELLSEMEKKADMFDVSVEDALLHYYQGW